MCSQDLEGVCREAGKQAHDWAASVRSMAELADHTGYEPSSGHNRSLVAIIAEKRERNRYISCGTSNKTLSMQCITYSVLLSPFGYEVEEVVASYPFLS